jgi:hypothetical protein
MNKLTNTQTHILSRASQQADRFACRSPAAGAAGLPTR